MIQGSRPEHPFQHEYEPITSDESDLNVRIYFASGGYEDRRYDVGSEDAMLTAEHVVEWSSERVRVTYTRADDRVEPQTK